ncbi:MAG: hypothetical protein IJY69_05620 [Clostridia bacterium]|nr:hypothetical protein [Clostridia bacterium]
MVIEPKKRNIAYRCPECGSAVIGLVGKFALAANLLRLKCTCGEGAPLDIKMESDGKIRLSVPCVFCKQNHSYTVSEAVFFDRELFLLNCPYAGMDIAFIGEESDIDEQLQRTENEIRQLMSALEAEELSDIQPAEMNEDEILPDPAVYDTLRFLVRDLEESGKLSCPCGEGEYDLRFCDGGVQVYCERCGATHTFYATTPTMAEEYLETEEIKLK